MPGEALDIDVNLVLRYRCKWKAAGCRKRGSLWGNFGELP